MIREWERTKQWSGDGPKMEWRWEERDETWSKGMVKVMATVAGTKLC